MAKKINVIEIKQNQVLEIPNDNNEIGEPEDNEIEPVIVDTTENEELHLEPVEVVESQDVSQDLTENVV